jgi:two-component system copper resistance phosphate regulon response regulator CusR
MILERVWGMRIEPKTNVVDVHMSRLRAKVDGGGRKPLIGTMRGMGYVLRNA